MARDTTALQKAIKGDKVTDRQAQGALSQAVDKIANLSKRAQKSKEAMAETGALVIHTAETQGSLFLSSMAEGYFGSDKLKMGAVDLRAPVGLLAQGYGLYEAMSGNLSAAGHALALGNGVMGSWLASVAVSAGQTLADKRDSGSAANAPGLAAPVTLTPNALQGLLPEPAAYDTELRGPLREVLLTPESSLEGDDDFEGRRRGGQRQRRPRRRRQGGEPREGGPRQGGRRRRHQMQRRGRFLRANRPEDAPEAEDDHELDPYFDEEPTE